VTTCFQFLVLLMLALLDTNRTRLVRKAHPTESFFNFFSPPVAPSEEAIEAGEIDEEELDELEEKLEIDYQIGEDIKEKVRSIRPYSCFAIPSSFRDLL
jgi:Nucleosome assembly protein (NAP)